MDRIEKTVDVPVTTAHNQQTQFEELPRFMEGVNVGDTLDEIQETVEEGSEDVAQGIEDALDDDGATETPEPGETPEG